MSVLRCDLYQVIIGLLLQQRKNGVPLFLHELIQSDHPKNGLITIFCGIAITKLKCTL